MQKTVAPLDAHIGARISVGFLAVLTAALALTALLPSTAAAARPEPLIQFPGDLEAGVGAGRMEGPQAIAASPVSGDLYVFDPENTRIDEFTAWGTFVRAFGWGVKSGDTASAGVDTCTTATGCQAGFSRGAEPGQFGSFGFGNGIAVDSVGDVYATDMSANHRMLKFSPTGEFLLMFGGEVDQTTHANVCTREDVEVDGDTCGAGVPGTGNSQFRGREFGNYVAVGPDDTIYVGDQERIQEFQSDGSFKGQITFKALHEELASFPEATNALGLAADPASGDLYLIAGSPSESSIDKNIYRIDPATGKLVGAPLSAPTLILPTALATDSAGDLYVVNNGKNISVGKENGFAEILEFDSAGNKLIPSKAEDEEREKIEKAKEKGEPVEPFERFGEPSTASGSFEERIELHAITTDAACESVGDDLYADYNRSQSGGISALSYVSAFGPPPQNIVKCPPPPPEPPEISAQYATSVGADAAVLGAEINPHFALDTTYYVQYGTGKCSEGGCEEEKPLPPGSSLTTKVSNTPLKSKGVFLTGLQPGTTYHYRFVAINSAGQVNGVGGEVGTDGEEASFTAFALPSKPKEDCANQAFRTGLSAHLVDCRAYELVSPAERDPAGDISAEVNGLGYPAELNQSATDGEKLAYSSEYAFGDALGAPFTTEYIASRHAEEGWSTHAISPPRESVLINNNANIKVDIEEKAFSADLCSSWLMHDTDPPLSTDAIAGFPNIYRRQNCGAGAESYEAVTSAEPSPSMQANHYWPELQGFSADGSQAVFGANAKLTGNAPDLGGAAYIGGQQLYESSEGTLHFVCILPDGTPYVGTCSAGASGNHRGEGRTANVEHAVSADGSQVYWNTTAGGLYLRENADREQSAMAAGKCTEEEKACSYAVSNAAAQFWTAAADGSKALYTTGGNLREYDAEAKKSKLIAEEAVGVAGASEDLARFYFVSKKKIGGEGEEGQPNLYRRDEGTTSLVATLSQDDLNGNLFHLALNPVSPLPIGHGARTSADGRHLLFASTESLTGYDNHDTGDGRPDDEIFLYEAGSAGPVCISCNPSGGRPTGRLFIGCCGSARTTAALIPPAENQLYAPHVLSEDGNRVFFDSFEALVARDTNGKEDVYEWERAGSGEACKENGAELYVESSGGCLSLISSGNSASDSEFVDTGNGGRDVFFKTDASLLPQDHGLRDIYDARELGGLPVPPSPSEPCEGEACQPASAAPNDPTAASASFNGEGNASPAKGRKPCPKGARRTSRKGKQRCIKRYHKRSSERTANHKRGGAR